MPDPTDNEERLQQWRVASIALDASQADSFALAGSGAIREHGLIDRPTDDVDLFTVARAQSDFEPAVDHVEQAVRDAGYQVDEETRMPGFARLTVTRESTGCRTDIDMGIDWRSTPPVRLAIGPVLDIRDAVGNKVAALFSRGESRDYLDVDAIRERGPFSDRELIDLAANADPGFDLDMFRRTLERATAISPDQVAAYGYTAGRLDGVKRRLTDFARQIGRGEISETRNTDRHAAPRTTDIDRGHRRHGHRHARG